MARRGGRERPSRTRGQGPDVLASCECLALRGRGNTLAHDRGAAPAERGGPGPRLLATQTGLQHQGRSRVAEPDAALRPPRRSVRVSMHVGKHVHTCVYCVVLCKCILCTRVRCFVHVSYVCVRVSVRACVHAHPQVIAETLGAWEEARRVETVLLDAGPVQTPRPGGAGAARGPAGTRRASTSALVMVAGLRGRSVLLNLVTTTPQS